MFNSSKWLLIGVLIILTIGIIGIGFHTFNKLTLIKKELKKEIQEAKEDMERLKEEIDQLKKKIPVEPEEISGIDTSNWKTYRDKILRVGFRYPKEWGWDGFLPPKNHLSLPGVYSLSVIEKNLFNIGIEQYCNEYLDLPFLRAPDLKLNCSEIKVSTGQKGILRDGLICSANLPGGSPECFYERSFIVKIPNEDYPILFVRTSWGYECFREKCDPFKLDLKKTIQECMQEEYEQCKMKENNKTKLQLFKIFINTIEIY